MNTRTCFCNTPFLTENSNKHCFEQIFSIITSTSKLSSAFKLHVITALWPRIDRSCQMTGEASIYKDKQCKSDPNLISRSICRSQKNGAVSLSPRQKQCLGQGHQANSLSRMRKKHCGCTEWIKNIQAWKACHPRSWNSNDKPFNPNPVEGTWGWLNNHSWMNEIARDDYCF